ncbi:MAG: hypothetical protein BYD32DRAFT_437206 [Podila humilis]|nr:MAG: hypothetical protein BYD32DRAFT_437206 [Podila humilis]
MHSSIRERVTETYKRFELNRNYFVEVVRVRDRVKVSNDRALAVEGDGDTWRFDIVLTKNLMPDVDGRMAQPGANIHDAQRELQKKDPSLRLTRIYASRVSNVTVPKALSGQNFIGDIGSGRYIFSARLLRGGADVLVKIFECERRRLTPTTAPSKGIETARVAMHTLANT